jgi:4-hydroxy-2-oxoheptanedioate aldolase
MRINQTLARLRAGESVIGSWLQLNCPPATRLLAAQGLFDWLLVDFEHSPPDPLTAQILLGSIADVSGGRVTPLARAADATMTAIELVLDCGAQGVIVPMVEDAETAARVVRSAHYPPQGERGAGGLLPHLGLGSSRPQYLAESNREVLVGIQIETAAAVERLDEILAVPGIDLIFVGPNDLHQSLGLPAQFWSQERLFLDAIARIKEGAARTGLPVGTLSRNAGEARARLEEGFRFIGLGSDAHFMLTFAGVEAGAVRDLPQPAGAWCDVVNFPANSIAPQELALERSVP